LVRRQTNPQLPLDLLGRVSPAMKPMLIGLGPCRRARWPFV